MENVKIKTCIDTGKTYKENPIFDIELQDGRKGSCFDKRAKNLKPGDDISFDIKDGGNDPNGNKKLYFNFPKEKKTYQKDLNYQKRYDSLHLSIKSIVFLKEDPTSEDVIKLAKKYFNYLNS